MRWFRLVMVVLHLTLSLWRLPILFALAHERASKGFLGKDVTTYEVFLKMQGFWTSRVVKLKFQ